MGHIFLLPNMGKKSPVSIFLAASTLLAANVLHPDLSYAGEGEAGSADIHHAGEGEGGEGHHHDHAGEGEGGEGEMGGLQEWSSDQDIDAESKPDAAAKKAAEKAKEADICIPIGEGENCW